MHCQRYYEPMRLKRPTLPRVKRNLRTGIKNTDKFSNRQDCCFGTTIERVGNARKSARRTWKRRNTSICSTRMRPNCTFCALRFGFDSKFNLQAHTLPRTSYDVRSRPARQMLASLLVEQPTNKARH